MERDPHSAIGQPGAELARIKAEAEALRRAGKFDRVARDRFHARMRGLFERDMRALDTRQAEVVSRAQRLHPSPTPVRTDRRVGIAVIASLVFLGGGLVLEMALGSRFAAVAGCQYKDHLIPIVMGLTPALWLLALIARRRQKRLNPQMPPARTWGVLKGALSMVVVAAGTVPALYGWTAVAGWAAGESRTDIAATLVSVSPARSVAKGCKQAGVIDIAGVESRICVYGMLDGVPERPGQRVLLSGQASRFGLLIDGLRLAAD